MEENENLFGILGMGSPDNKYTARPPIYIDNQDVIELHYDDTLSTDSQGRLTVVGGGGGTEYTIGKGLKLSGNNLSAKTYVVQRTNGKSLYLNQSLGGYKYDVIDAPYYKKFDTDNYIDLVEVTSDASGCWGNYSYNVYTADDENEKVYVWAYQTGHYSDVSHCMVYFWTLYNDSVDTVPSNLAEEYMQQQRKKMNSVDEIEIAKLSNMYIPNKPDIIIPKSEQSFDLSEYIPKIYYSGQEGNVHKVDLKDCYISEFDTSKVGVQKIQIKYTGEFNKYPDKMNIGAETIYIKVVE